jgi:hypothetical protein
MGGGLVQLVAIGAQDVYLTKSPQITFWKSVYRRHTNFAIESVQQSISGDKVFGSRIAVTISKNGDLLKKLWIQYNPQEVLAGIIPSVVGDVIGANVGHAILNTIQLEIGGQLIDTQYGKWLTIWNYLIEVNPTGAQGSVDSPNWPEPSHNNNAYNYTTEEPGSLYNTMAYTHRCNKGEAGAVNTDRPPNQAYVPLQFWFCKNPGLALPLIALQYHEVKVIITFGNWNGIYYPVGGVPRNTLKDEFKSLQVFADYVYLDTTERKQFTQNAHEYLIDQLQINNNINTTTINLNFKNPVKEIIWSPIPLPVTDTFLTPNLTIPGNASPNNSLDDTDYELFFNGISRFTPRNVKYFTRTQVWEYHTGYGSILFPNCIAVYSFALRPQEHQPSGTCNFSRLDSAKLQRTSTDAIDVYAINYNILRIMSGMGGLAYI